MNKKIIQRTAIIVGVLIIPLLYSFLYLKAFYDPYNSLDQLPVAIVNEDNGALINGKEQNLGKEMTNQLKKNDTLKFVITDNKDAKKGVEKEKYYASITIPEDFSKKISTACEEDKQEAKIIYSSNEKRNYLAAQILKNAVLQIETTLQKNITKEIVGTLEDNINEVPKSLNQINDGVTSLANGSSQVLSGTSTLNGGTNKLYSNYQTFNSSLNELNNGVISLASGSQEFTGGLNRISEGAKELNSRTEKLSTLSSSIDLLSSKTSELDNGVVEYTSGVDELISQTGEVATLLQNYLSEHPEAMNDENMQKIIKSLSSQETSQKINKLSNGGEYLRANTNALATKTNELNSESSSLPVIHEKINEIDLGLEQLQFYNNQIVNGINNISNGTNQLTNASVQILSGINTLNNGAYTLDNGVKKMDNGINDLGNGINSGIEKINDKKKALNEIDEYSVNSFEVENDVIEPVPNYGTSFAPYFMSLSLWVGGILIFFGIYLDQDSRFEILSRNSKHPFKRTFIFLLIGLLQALIVALILHSVLGIEVKHLGYYYLACCLVSVVFVSIIQFLMIFFKDIGKFLTILLLILQLTSCGGTFPMETVPKFFNVLYPFMPMTYSVKLFKETISGSDTSMLFSSTMILLGILIVTSTLTLIFSKQKHKKEV